MQTHTLSILALGDSLTEGMVSWGEPMAPYSDHLPALLAPHLAVLWSVSVSNQGVSGELTEEIKDRAPYKTKWDVAVILGGTNDLGDVDVDAIWDNLRDMYAKFEAAHAVVVAVTVPNVCMVRLEHQPQWLTTSRNALNNKIRAWTKEAPSRRVLVDLWAEMPTDEAHKALWSRDGLHFSAEGYKLFASLVAAQLGSSAATIGKPWHKKV